MSIVLEANIATLENISRVSKADNGYYKVLMGGLNVVNSEGYRYVATDAVKNLITKSQSLNRQIANGTLISEVEHPKIQPGEDKAAFADRFMSLSKKNECGFIKQITLSDNPVRVKGQDEPVYLIWGLIKPQGIHGEALKQSLDNPDTNTAFSIRCLSRRNDVDRTRTILYIITWDWVNEPGINIATQATQGSLTTECVTLSNDDIEDVVNTLNATELTDESADRVNEIKDVLKLCIGDKCIYNDF